MVRDRSKLPISFQENKKVNLMVRDKNKLPLAIQKNKRIKLLICDIRECNRFSKEISQVNFLIHLSLIHI